MGRKIPLFRRPLHTKEIVNPRPASSFSFFFTACPSPGPGRSSVSRTVIRKRYSNEGRGEKIRVYGIDCPEKRQAFGSKAKQATSTLVFGKVVEVEPVNVDRYGRTVALVTVGTTLVNEELIRQGLAWVYVQYCERPVCEKWRQVEAAALVRKRGLWADPSPVPPWEFRRQEK
jgi:endonuclease YncB( thermonuclease family)